jgi:hypothetical protein
MTTVYYQFYIHIQIQLDWPILIKYSYKKYGVEKAVYDEQNALKLTYEHLRTQIIFRGSYPGPPVIRGGERGGRQEEGNEGKGRMARIGKGIAFFNI